MATNRNKGLRTPEPVLSSSRQQFIQSLENKKQFEADCAVIIPELTLQWREKILRPFMVEPLDPTQIIGEVNWKHYLFNYAPQLLSQAITRLASRLKLVDGVLHNARGPVENLSAYYKAIVQDLRKKKRYVVTVKVGDEKFSQPLMADSDVELLPVVPQISQNQPASFGIGLKPECQTCFDEEGSYACIRYAHRVKRAE